MWADDEAVFGRALDESRNEAGLIESLHGDRLIRTIAAFEIHGSTLRQLAKWYPDEPCVGRAAREWESLRFDLEERASKEVRSLFADLGVARI